MSAHRRTISWRQRALFAIVTVFTAGRPAMAQDFSGMIDSSFQNMSSFAGTTAVNAAIGQSARYAAGMGPQARARRQSSPSVTAPNPADLRFHPTAAVTAQNNARVLAAFDQVSPQVDASTLRQALDNGQLLGTFSRLLKTANFSSTNLADVLTGYLVISWEVVNGEDSRQHATGYAVVRNRLAQSLGVDPDIARMSDADKQQFCETLSILAMLAAATRDGLQQTGHADQLPALREGVRRTGLKLGVDLATLAFTDAGFVPR